MKRLVGLGLSFCLISTSTFAFDLNQCIQTVSDAVRETLRLDKNVAIEEATRDWFCEDTTFNQYLESHQNSEVTVLLKNVPVNFKFGSDENKSQEQRRKYCQENQFSMKSRELISTMRTVVSPDYVEALDRCAASYESYLGVKDPVIATLEPLSDSVVRLSLKATPRSFGETTPIVVGVQGNVTCPSLPSRGVPLSRDAYELNCSYQLKPCEVGYLNVQTSTDKATEASFYVPKEGALGTVVVKYTVPTFKWVSDGRRSVQGHTTGGNLKCDDDGDYEGGHAVGTLNASVSGHRRIKADNISISCTGGAAFTCTSSPIFLNNQSIQGAIQHHSCAGSPKFTMSYEVFKRVTVNEPRTSRSSAITAGGNTSPTIDENAQNVRVEIQRPNGEIVTIDGLQGNRSRGSSGEFLARRTATGVVVVAKDTCQ